MCDFPKVTDLGNLNVLSKRNVEVIGTEMRVWEGSTKRKHFALPK